MGSVPSTLASVGVADMWRVSKSNQSAHVGHHKQFYMW